MHRNHAVIVSYSFFCLVTFYFWFLSLFNWFLLVSVQLFFVGHCSTTMRIWPLTIWNPETFEAIAMVPTTWKLDHFFGFTLFGLDWHSWRISKVSILVLFIDDSTSFRRYGSQFHKLAPSTQRTSFCTTKMNPEINFKKHNKFGQLMTSH